MRVNSSGVQQSPPLVLQNLEVSPTDVHQVDRILCAQDEGVDRGIERVKLTIKYSSILVHYIETRTKSLVDYLQCLKIYLK